MGPVFNQETNSNCYIKLILTSLFMELTEQKICNYPPSAHKFFIIFDMCCLKKKHFFQVQGLLSSQRLALQAQWKKLFLILEENIPMP